MSKIGRNDLCPSGAGTKFKKCLANHPGLRPDATPAHIWWACDRWTAPEPTLLDLFLAAGSAPTLVPQRAAYMVDRCLADPPAGVAWDKVLSIAIKGAYPEPAQLFATILDRTRTGSPRSQASFLALAALALAPNHPQALPRVAEAAVALAAVPEARQELVAVADVLASHQLEAEASNLRTLCALPPTQETLPATDAAPTAPAAPAPTDPEGLKALLEATDRVLKGGDPNPEDHAAIARLLASSQRAESVPVLTRLAGNGHEDAALAIVEEMFALGSGPGPADPFEGAAAWLLVLRGSRIIREKRGRAETAQLEAELRARLSDRMPAPLASALARVLRGESLAAAWSKKRFSLIGPDPVQFYGATASWDSMFRSVTHASKEGRNPTRLLLGYALMQQAAFADRDSRQRDARCGVETLLDFLSPPGMEARVHRCSVPAAAGVRERVGWIFDALETLAWFAHRHGVRHTAETERSLAEIERLRTSQTAAA